MWIYIAVAVVALLLVIVGVGVVIGQRRRAIRLTPPPISAPEASNYQAKGGFSFSEGGSPTTTVERPKDPSFDSHSETIGGPHSANKNEKLADSLSDPGTIPPRTVGREWTPTGLPGVGDDASIPVDSEKPTLRDVALPDLDDGDVSPDAAEKIPSVEDSHTDTTSQHETESDSETIPEPDPDRVRSEDVQQEADLTQGAPASEDIVPGDQRWANLRGRLSRSQTSVGRALVSLLGGGDLDEESWEDVESTLLAADLGATTTEGVVGKLREALARSEVRTESQARALLREVLIAELQPELNRSIQALPHVDRPSVVLIVGVNGTGKTTTTGKLARVLVADGRRVLLGAADTFRAAAVEQLATWGNRVGAEVISGAEGADPASVAFEAVNRGVDAGADVVVIDTAGRLHTKTGLMDELGKIKRVVEKKAGVDEVILVLDATIGQNGLMQAKVFSEVVEVTGVALTKLDGTAKGGIVFAVQRALGVPVKLVGLGEGKDDLAPFEPAAFVDALLG